MAHFRNVAVAFFVVAPVAYASDAPRPVGDELLRQMSSKLATAKSFSFQATREIDPALLEGRQIPEKARVTVRVQRPGKLAAQAESKDGIRRFITDGKWLTVVDESRKHYATASAPGTIDGLVEKLDAEYGFTPPLAEFALSNPYADFRRQADQVTYLGRASMAFGFLGLGSVECERIGLKGKVADAELWVGVEDRLPRKLVATFHRPGNPQVRVQFAKWDLNASIPPQEFIFTPTAGMERIEIWTTARMRAAAKR